MCRLRNAKVVQNEDGSFTIQPEDDGNMVDTQKLSDYTIAQMREGNNTINMAESDCYKKAAVTAESLKTHSGAVQQDRRRGNYL